MVLHVKEDGKAGGEGQRRQKEDISRKGGKRERENGRKGGKGETERRS